MVSAATQADVEALDNKSDHALNVAAKHNNAEVLQLLIDAKSSVDRPNTAGDTALIQVRMWEASAVRVRAAACACKQFCAHPSSDLWTNAFPSCTLM